MTSDTEEHVQEELTKGQILKNARIEQGLSLETIHEATKVPLDVLKAIEEGYTVRTLSEFYFNGFLKIYSKYLGVKIFNDAEKKPVRISKRANKSFTEEFDLQSWSSKILTKRVKRQIFLVAAGAVSLFILFKITSSIVHFIANRPAKEEKPVLTQKKEDVPVNVVEKVNGVALKEAPKVVQKVADAKPVTVQEPPPVIARSVTLTVRAKEKSWLRVKSDDQVVFQSTLGAGSVETWNADKEIELSGKNISTLELEINGKLIGTLGRSDRTAKKLLITKDGLSVSK